MSNDMHVFFWDGPFSNWYAAEFTDENGMTFCNVEQYMMYAKAKIFQDIETAISIMAATNPRTIKRMGRQVEGFSDEVWDIHKVEVVKEACRLKFTQNPRLKAYMLRHKGFQIVEASPYDRVWGIGYGEKDAMSNIDNWGENLLGKILTELSEEITE